MPEEKKIPSFTNELRFGDKRGRSSDDDEVHRYGLNKFPFDVEADSIGISTFKSAFESAPPPLKFDELSCRAVGIDIFGIQK